MADEKSRPPRPRSAGRSKPPTVAPPPCQGRGRRGEGGTRGVKRANASAEKGVRAMVAVGAEEERQNAHGGQELLGDVPLSQRVTQLVEGAALPEALSVD